VVPERVGEDEDHRYDKCTIAVDSIHCEAHEQSAGDGGRGVRLFAREVIGGSHGTVFRAGPDAAEACGEAGVAMETTARWWRYPLGVLLMLETLRMTGLRLSAQQQAWVWFTRVAAAM